MAVHSRRLTIDSHAPAEIVDITERVREVLLERSVRQGLVLVATRHTTAAIRIGEAEPGLYADLLEFLARLAPPGAGYRHDREPVDGRGNAHSHLAAFLLGASEGVPVVDGALALGTWQRILFVELDGPREGREVVVTVLGQGPGEVF